MRASLTLCVVGLLTIAAANEAPRPIASLTTEQRSKLPDNTQVVLPDHREVTLGQLRAEHKARMERMSKAGELASKIEIRNVHPAQSGATMPSERPGQPSSGPPKSGATRKSGAVTPQIGGALLTAGTLIPGHLHYTIGMQPKDYRDFCSGAKASVCLYLPAGISLVVSGQWAIDLDYLIVDKTVCEADGGGWFITKEGGIACEFPYPIVDLVNFVPSGAVSIGAECSAPFSYIYDPKGAIQAKYGVSGVGVNDGTTITAGATPQTCVVRAWVAK